MKTLISSASVLMIFFSYASATSDYSFGGSSDVVVAISGGTDAALSATSSAPIGAEINGNTGNNPYGYGVWAQGGGSVGGTGVRAMASGGTEEGLTLYGTESYAAGGDLGYGIFAQAYYCTTCFAGYFSGNVTVTGTFSNPSDRKLKKDIKALDAGLNEILALQPKTYRMDLETYADFGFAKGQQFGVIAQDLEKVLPNLVTENVHVKPATLEERAKGIKTERTEYKSVDYLGLIPVLIKGMQEQQAQIQSQQNAIAALQAELANLKGR